MHKSIRVAERDIAVKKPTLARVTRVLTFMEDKSSPAEFIRVLDDVCNTPGVADELTPAEAGQLLSEFVSLGWLSESDQKKSDSPS